MISATLMACLIPKSIMISLEPPLDRERVSVSRKRGRAFSDEQRAPNAKRRSLDSRNGVCPHLPVQPLNLLPLPTPGISQSSKDLTRLAGAEIERLGRLRLEEGNCAPAAHREGIGVVDGTLVDDALDPRVSRLDAHGHVGELGANDRVVALRARRRAAREESPKSA